MVLNDIKFILIACATIGLVPFVPEPHIWGKLRWIAGGATGMGPQDWFDVALHGWPWVLLLRWGVLKMIKKTKKNGKETIIQRADQR